MMNIMKGKVQWEASDETQGWKLGIYLKICSTAASLQDLSKVMTPSNAGSLLRSEFFSSTLKRT